MKRAAVRHASPNRTYTLSNLDQIPQLASLPREVSENVRIVGSVLPFKANNYVVDELIDWDNFESDPIFHLTFPQRGMLLPEHFAAAAAVAGPDVDPSRRGAVINGIRSLLNPHPAGQMDRNVPEVGGERLWGVQHKYRETVLFFPSAGQTCHAYCTFCFRWPQFIGMSEFRFASREIESLVEYLRGHPEATDLLFTGGDPLIMGTNVLARYLEPLLDPGNGTNIQTIRLGTKALGYWPYRFTTDPDADDLMRLFERVTGQGLNLAIMAHFSHPRELETVAVREAIARIRGTGAQIRTQSPLLRNINDSSAVWSRMWREQVNLNCIPYYMFIARNTGAQHYFAVPLVEAWEIWRGAYRDVSGVCRTVRGPSMSCNPGKVQVLGVTEAGGERVLALRFLQGRDPDWVGRPFFARYDPAAIWMNELRPAFGDRFFFESEGARDMEEDEEEEAVRYE